MKPRIILLVACGVMCVVVIAVAAYSRRQSQPTQAASSSTGNSIQARAVRARAEGKKELTIFAPDLEYTGSSSSTDLDKALSSYTAVVARPLKVQSYIAENGEDVITWNRFEVIETLSENEKPACAACPVPTPPEDFSEVKKNEFSMVKIGGTVMVDGVKVTMTDRSFPDFEVGKKYLLFISKYPSGVATLGIGPKGVFEVNDLGDIRGVNQVPHAVKSDIEERFNHSLLNLRQYSQVFKKKP